MRRFDFSQPDFAQTFAAFADARRETPEDVEAIVRDVLTAVKAEGLAAVLRFARQFDRAEIDESNLRVTEEEIAQGAAACAPEVREAIALAAGRIRAYHERQRPADARFVDETGAELGWRWSPLEAVGVYVPGGRAAYPSTVLMNAVPAAAAGVSRIAMVTPPGKLQPAVLAAAQAAGVTEIWRVGGAQAVAALAYGAGPIKPVDKIVGPGNAFVTAAKRRVYGVVGIDALAGPSEIVVVADGQNRAEIEAQLKTLSTGEAAGQSWRDHGAIIIAPLGEAPALVDRLAPEHVEFAVADPDALAERVRHAGAMFLGRWTPEAIGDYVAGSNHVLPTSRAARFSSGLSLYDFIKRTSIVKCDERAFAALGPATVALAESEGLPAHARSAALRLGQTKS